MLKEAAPLNQKAEFLSLVLYQAHVGSRLCHRRDQRCYWHLYMGLL